MKEGNAQLLEEYTFRPARMRAVSEIAVPGIDKHQGENGRILQDPVWSPLKNMESCTNILCST